MPEAAIAFGSNLGDRRGTLIKALALLEADDAIRVLHISPFYETEPWGDPDQERYINGCILVETELSPSSLLQRCLKVETSLGRVRDPARRYGARTIDLDIVFYDDLRVDQPDLVLPHPRLFERAFVLVPLMDVAGDREIAGRRLSEALEQLDLSGVQLWEG
ncbi:2-amino-4-hydroxy-6-hydroxymethyldihydropteridine diphosphokinase [Agaricicola taiwanensis]|uniref:2-amino-4-hydroxy-6-hydroxymethyldihydropteridine pyrophosphokinase n=1 Tax=Agaricicola taiwanensis TaxID=591372 RepID=A0A8J2VLQ7_9RHOB|nr:2-amino-4-hydroxy-6-hydroxymethyldihydropteridine diphosphokinase [Agaricicola taiwanensis]GGE36804.1 2-amino-4-hydroxy-6-hydroxymethyldihydropteridine diphosphokinase [Agaricicola taiwanensis]